MVYYIRLLQVPDFTLERLSEALLWDVKLRGTTEPTQNELR